MNTGHFVATNRRDRQLVGCNLIATRLRTISCVLEALNPLVFAVKVIDYLFCKGNGCSRWCIKFVNMVHFLHLNVILWETIHYLCQITVDS